MRGLERSAESSAGESEARGSRPETRSGRSRTGPILVTGAHRSGSTWVGRMIACSPAIRYIHEPFNPDAFAPGICGVRFEREFTYVCEENAGPYQVALERCLQFRYGLRRTIGQVRTPKSAIRVGRDLGRCAISRLTRARPLMKDPHAVFSADWLSRRFDMDVVVLIRHPAAFVGSIKKFQWAFRFEQFLEQPLLMQRYLGEFEREIAAFAAEPADIVDQGILLWNAIYRTVARHREEHPDWIFARHEDLSRQPDEAFRGLFRRLGVDYTEKVRAQIAEFSSPTNPSEQHSENQIKRNSRANIWNWKTRLTREEIERVRNGTRKVASQFYTDADWRPA